VFDFVYIRISEEAQQRRRGRRRRRRLQDLLRGVKDEVEVKDVEVKDVEVKDVEVKDEVEVMDKIEDDVEDEIKDMFPGSSPSRALTPDTLALTSF